MSNNPSTNRKVVYYIATSLDNFIAREDGDVRDFLTEGNHIPDYLESLQVYDTVLMGRRTYEKGYEYGIQAGQPSPTYAHMMQYVLSQSMEQFDHEQLKVIHQDAAEFVTDLKEKEGRAIYLCGGGHLAGYLLDHSLVDEIILKVNPIVLGSGIPAFGNSKAEFNLSLLDTKIYNNGVLFQHFAVSS